MTACRWLGIAALLLAAPACDACQSAGSAPSGRDDACRSACAAMTEAGCHAFDTGTQPACVRDCVAHRDRTAPAGCESVRQAFYACVSRAEIECAKAGGSAWKSLEHGLGVPACVDEYSTFSRCFEPCDGAGQILTGSRRDGGVDYELVRAGCEDCPRPKPGAPPGSRCTAASVCAQHCCRCKTGSGVFLSQLCVAGACASAEEACEIDSRVGSDLGRRACGQR